MDNKIDVILSQEDIDNDLIFKGDDNYSTIYDNRYYGSPDIKSWIFKNFDDEVYVMLDNIVSKIKRNDDIDTLFNYEDVIAVVKLYTIHYDNVEELMYNIKNIYLPINDSKKSEVITNLLELVDNESHINKKSFTFRLIFSIKREELSREIVEIGEYKISLSRKNLIFKRNHIFLNNKLMVEQGVKLEISYYYPKEDEKLYFNFCGVIIELTSEVDRFYKHIPEPFISLRFTDIYTYRSNIAIINECDFKKYGIYKTIDEARKADGVKKIVKRIEITKKDTDRIIEAVMENDKILTELRSNFYKRKTDVVKLIKQLKEIEKLDKGIEREGISLKKEELSALRSSLEVVNKFL